MPEWSRVGMGIPETDIRRARWAAAAPKLSMALAEAGRPNHLEPLSLPIWPAVSTLENALVFPGVKPDDDVLRRAAAICGVEDILDELLTNGCGCAHCATSEASKSRGGIR